MFITAVCVLFLVIPQDDLSKSLAQQIQQTIIAIHSPVSNSKLLLNTNINDTFIQG